MTNSIQFSFGLRMGETEFQVAGDKEFVERETTRWLQLFKGKLPAELDPEAIPSRPQSQGNAVKQTSGRRLPTLGEFIKTKGPKEIDDMILVVGLYMERFQQKQMFKIKDLMDSIFTRLNRSEEEVSNHLAELVEKSMLSETETMGSTEPSYSLTFSGEQMVKEGFTN